MTHRSSQEYERVQELTPVPPYRALNVLSLGLNLAWDRVRCSFRKRFRCPLLPPRDHELSHYLSANCCTRSVIDMDMILDLTETIATAGPLCHWLWKISWVVSLAEGAEGLTRGQSYFAATASTGVFAATVARAWLLPGSALLLFSSSCWVIVTMVLLDRVRVNAECFVWSAVLHVAGCFVEVMWTRPRWIPMLLRGFGVVQLIILSVIATTVKPRNKIGGNEESQPLLTSSSRRSDDTSDIDDAASSTRQASWRFTRDICNTFGPHLWPRSAVLTRHLAITIVSLVTIRVVKVIQPLFLRMVISELSERRNPTSSLVGFLVLRQLDSAVTSLQDGSLRRLESLCESSLERHSFSHILRLSADYHTNKSSPEILQIMERGRSIIPLLLNALFHLMPQALDVMVTLPVIAGVFHREICLVVLTTMLVSVWFARQLASKERYKDYVRNWHSRNRRTSEAFASWRTVQEACNEDLETIKHRSASDRLDSSWAALLRDRDNLLRWRDLLEGLGFAMACFLAVRPISHGRSDAGSLVLLLTYWSQSLLPVKSLVYEASGMPQDLVQAEELMTVLAKRPSVVDLDNAFAMGGPPATIEFDQVSFAYPGQQPVLHNISFRVTRGQTVAIVGKSGSGKSTLFSLILRLFDPTEGRILVDDTDLRAVQHRSYRIHVGVVPQDARFWDDSILENVRYLAPETSEAQAVEMCTKVNLHDTIVGLPGQYRHRMGEGGQVLSGGQRQRLAIARALLKQCGVMMFDEPTNGLDTITEHHIRRCMEQGARRRTTFVISHRLSTIRQANLILVMDQGSVVERGTHEELSRQPDGLYNKLWTAQQDETAGLV